MKQTLLIFVLTLAGMAAAQAQKGEDFRNTQARMLDVNSNAYVRPVTVELDVNPVKIDTTYFLSKEMAEVGMGGDIPNIRSWGVYQASTDFKCDVIVAATFVIESETKDKKPGYTLRITGFPAKYKNWATATDNDIEWIREEKIQTAVGNAQKIAPIVK